MNKKVDEEFVGIKDVYALQCLVTELKRNNINEILKSDYDLLCKDYKKATKKIEKQEQEIERLKTICKKMHLWIFLNSGDEQKIYDEIGLTKEENEMLGYSGQLKIKGDKE